MDNVVADSIHEILRVGDENEDLFVARQLLLQPDAGLQIQVIGRLVQKQ